MGGKAKTRACNGHGTSSDRLAPECCYIAGHVNDVTKNGAHNGFDAWRKLMRAQLPLAEDKRNILMTEFMSLKAANARGIRQTLLDIERITDHWSRLANKPFDEETTVGKLREFIPNNAREFVAQRAWETKS